MADAVKMTTGTLLTNSLVTLYTVDVNTTARVDAIILTNHDTSPRLVTVNLVDSGDSAADKNEVIDPTGYIVGAGEMRGVDLAQVLTAGDFLQAMADVTGVVSIRISGVEF